MLTAAGLALGAVLRPGRAVEMFALAGVMYLPAWLSVGLLVAVGAYARRVSVDPFDEAAYLQAVAAQLRSGQSVRLGVIAAAASAPGLYLDHAIRVAESGQPMEEVARALAVALPDSGELLEAAVRISSESGGSIAPVFSTLAAIQTDRIELAREVSAATASVRASVFVVGGLPIVGLAYSVATGRLAALASFGSAGIVLVILGVFLLASGAGAIVVLSRTSAR